MKKYSVLMYNFNDYEIMREPKEVDPECEYIYVTDNPKYQNETKVWNVIVDKMDGLSDFEKVYSVKYNPFKYCTTDTVIELDGSIQIYKKLDQLYNDFNASGCELGVIVHPLRFSITNEYEIWKMCRKYPEEQKQKCLKAMISMGYDFNYKGLYETTVRIVKNTIKNKMINESTFELLKKLDDKIERIDRCIFSFLINHLYNDTSVFPMSEQIIHSDFMKLNYHNKDEVVIFDSNTDVRDVGFLFNKLVKLYKLNEPSNFNKNVQRDIVVTMTSWKKRINNVSRTIVTLLKNTIKPRSIELNLSEEEFQNKEKDLPDDLILLTKKFPVNINWVGVNTKSFKKLIPTLKKYWNEKDLYIFTADDDITYQPDILERFKESMLDNEEKKVVCFGNFVCRLKNQPVVRGGACMYKVDFFTEKLWEDLTDDVIQTNEDDWWYSYHFLKNGGRKVFYTGISLKFFNEAGRHQYNTRNTYRLLLEKLKE